MSSARNKPSSVRRVCIASRQRRQRGGIIYLGSTLLPTSSGLPGTQVARAAPRPLFGLAPSGVCRATSVSSGPVRSYRTLSPLPVRPARTRAAIGGLLSAALSVALRRPGVTRHPALWSSDFPPAAPRKARQRSLLARSSRTRNPAQRAGFRRSIWIVKAKDEGHPSKGNRAPLTLSETRLSLGRSPEDIEGHNWGSRGCRDPKKEVRTHAFEKTHSVGCRGSLVR